MRVIQSLAIMIGIMVMTLAPMSAHSITITAINLNDFFFIAGDPVTIAPNGSSATIGEDPAFFSIRLFNDPFIGDPEVVIGGPGVELKFEFDFSEPAGNVDEFFVVVFDSDTGFSLGPSFEFFADSTSSGSVTFDLSSLAPSTPVLGMEFQLNSIFGDGGFDSSVTISDLRLESPGVPVPEPSSTVLMGIGLIGLIGFGWRKQKQAAKASNA